MFDTEGFQNINSPQTATRKHRLKGASDVHLSKAALAKKCYSTFKRDKSSKKLNDLTSIRKPGKATYPLIRIWVEAEKAGIHKAHFS